MRIVVLGLLAATTLGACTEDGYGPSRSYSSAYVQYDYNRPDPAYGGYYADRYYRDDNRRYRERRLSRNDRVYRGQDGRYYCRRSDGTTGLIVGGVAGGLLGNLIAPGGSEVLGTVLGAAAGAAIGSSADRNEVRCR
ncbi:glycine zipper 2TM domain-containing protein [Sphingomonas soli]|uniref:glycine zipper 2TM domain-containing protein n=1 Tax=Sphingomonas soli TaxID=266127 RepID=UPI000B33B054|nr:glycine zipper 2TM domain-containing protein [Sphingomonas soli]